MNLMKDFISISRCISCANSLSLNGEKSFTCSQCNSSYAVANGIPRFVPNEDYTASFGYQWNIHSATQLDKFNGLTISRDRLFNESKWNPSELKGKMVLECGSGAGRFTQVLCDSGSKTFTIDFSRAVDANFKSNGNCENVFIAQASIYELPFKEKTFDYLLCLGVIQHTPDVKKTVECMLKYLKPSGKFCIDVYAAPISYFHPRFLLRPFTKKMDKKNLYDLISKWVPKLLPLSTFLHKIPFIGEALARLIPIANWRANIKLPSEELYKEWTILDTFDWLSPSFESPQCRSTLNKWMKEFGVTKYTIERQRGLYIIRGEVS